MNKAANLYSECVDLLDDIERTCLEILESGHGLDKDKYYILKMATGIVRDYESLSPELQDAMIEIDDRIKAGEMTLEDALDLVTSAEPSEHYNKIDNCINTKLH